MTQQAKPVVKNKFWIVEENGRKVGTIQAVPDGVVFVHGHQREKFPTFKLLSKKHNINVARGRQQNRENINSVYDYPCEGPVYNPVYDLKLRLPLYTKEDKSKSYYCAGYYLVEVEESHWVSMYCPKKLILTRNRYQGPFRTIAECNNVKNSD